MSSIEMINSAENKNHPHILSHAVKIPLQSSQYPALQGIFFNRSTQLNLKLGLIYLSGQTPHTKDGQLAPGGIAEHTVSLVSLFDISTQPPVDPMYHQSRQCTHSRWFLLGEGCKSQRLLEEHGRLCCNERSL